MKFTMIKPRHLLVFALIFYLASRFIMLDRFPLLQMDETWMANISYGLARNGELASRLWLDVSPQYSILPAFIFIEAGFFQTLGFSLVTIRLTVVVLGFITLIGVYLLAKNLLPDSTYAAAIAVFMLSVEFLFVVFTRSGRGVDLTTSLFAVWAALFLCLGAKTSQRRWTFAAGTSVAAMMCSHWLGVMLSPFFAILAFLNLNSTLNKPEKLTHGSVKTFLWFTSGAAVLLVPYAWYMLSDLQEAIKQIQMNSETLGWVERFLSEPNRYLEWIFTLPSSPIPFSIFTVIVFLGSGVIVIIRAIQRRTPTAVFLAIVIVGTMIALGALPHKTKYYFATLIPFLAVAVALVLSDLSEKMGQNRWYRLKINHWVILLVIVFLLNNVANLAGALWLHRTNATPEVLQQLGEYIGDDEIIVGDATWWLANPENITRDYRNPSLFAHATQDCDWFQFDERFATLIVDTSPQPYQPFPQWPEVIKTRAKIDKTFSVNDFTSINVYRINMLPKDCVPADKTE